MGPQKSENVAIIGASNKPDRYSYKAFKMISAYGHRPFPVHPRIKEIEGVHCFPSVEALSESGISIDTVTLYLRAALSAPLEDALLALKPVRVIFNPGAENHALAKALRKNGIEPVNGCTLVMLQSGVF